MWSDDKAGHSVKTSASSQVRPGLASLLRHSSLLSAWGQRFLSASFTNKTLWPASPLMLSEGSCWECSEVGRGAWKMGRPGPGPHGERGQGVPPRNVMHVSLRS